MSWRGVPIRWRVGYVDAFGDTHGLVIRWGVWYVEFSPRGWRWVSWRPWNLCRSYGGYFGFLFVERYFDTAAANGFAWMHGMEGAA